MDHEPFSYRSHIRVLLLAMGLEFLLPCTAQMLDISPYGVLLSYMWYTKQILFCLYFYSGSAGTLISSNPPSNPRWLDLSSDIDFLLVVGFPVEPILASETFVVSIDISSVVIVS
jgi:hypothetical protein